MSDTIESLPVRNNAEKKRYEIQLGDRLAMIQYRLNNNRITFVHTEVPPALEGQGIASKMTKFALDEARDRGYAVRPLCPFVAGYIKRHPEYQSLVA